MIVILHPRSCTAVAERAADDLVSAFSGHVEVRRVEAEAAVVWPAAEKGWDGYVTYFADDGVELPNGESAVKGSRRSANLWVIGLPA